MKRQVAVLIEEHVLDALDSIGTKRHLSRAELIRIAIWYWIANKEFSMYASTKEKLDKEFYGG